MSADVTWNEDRTFRQQIVEVHRHLYNLGFSVANDGNTSVRVDPKRILITPIGVSKARLTPDQMVLLDMEGNPVGASAYAPSSEKALHVAIYRVRPDIRAIIHAHPPFAIACSLAGVSLSDYFLPEIILSLGKIPTVQYVTPSTKEFGEAAAEQAKKHDALILDRHGTVTVGTTLDEAMERVERLEQAAKIAMLARAMGTVTPLPKTEVDRLLEISHAPRESEDEKPKEAGRHSYDPALIELITREVKAALKRD
ncbi:MAG: class II aldolase/adducin family protein [Pseudomonadota bacterium]